MRVHDEVCGMTIDSEAAAASAGFEGKTCYFCSERWRRRFEEHPERSASVTAAWDGAGIAGGKRAQR